MVGTKVIHMAQQPIHKFGAGSVSCAIWKNEATVNGRTMPMLKATVERRYTDKDGNWKSSGSFSRNEIPLAIHVLQQAFSAMLEQSGDDDGPQQPVVEEVIE